MVQWICSLENVTFVGVPAAVCDEKINQMSGVLCSESYEHISKVQVRWLSVVLNNKLVEISREREREGGDREGSRLISREIKLTISH